jgi:acyl-phosphate glycerol 3-phosphate acyltransferase
MPPTLLLPLVCLGAYLIGAIPFGYLIARARGVDIFAAGSGNIGATNVGRVLGRRFGILVFLLDFSKGALPTAVARWLTGVADPTDAPLPVAALEVAAGLCAFLGHLFPVYLRFRGGKGIATGAGVVAVLLPLAALGAAGVWLVVVAAARYVSLASLAAAVALCLLHLAATPAPFAEQSRILTAFCFLAAVLVFARHRKNITRLIRGTENRLQDTPTMRTLARTLHVLAVGLWFGSAVFFTFVVAVSLFRSFEGLAQEPRDARPLWFPLPDEYGVKPETRKEQGTRAAGHAVGPLFDVYYPLQGLCGFIAVLTALGWSRADPASKVHKVRVWVLLAALATVLAGWPMERHVSALRVARTETAEDLMRRDLRKARVVNEKTDPAYERAAAAATEARAEFGRWHFYSLMVNFVTVLLVTVAMALAARLPQAQLPAPATPAAVAGGSAASAAPAPSPVPAGESTQG